MKASPSCLHYSRRCQIAWSPVGSASDPALEEKLLRPSGVAHGPAWSVVNVNLPRVQLHISCPAVIIEVFACEDAAELTTMPDDWQVPQAHCPKERVCTTDCCSVLDAVGSYVHIRLQVHF